jgi:hypothetical protein
VPLACDISALDPAQRRRHRELVDRLIRGVREVREADEGLVLRFPLEAWPEVCELVLLERRCCPFLAFHLELGPGAEDFDLALTGPPGVHDFLRAEFPALPVPGSSRCAHPDRE